MTKIQTIVALMLFFVLLLAGCARGEEAANAGGSNATGATEAAANVDAASAEKNGEGGDAAALPVDADLATDFTMKTLAGEEISLASLRGQFVLVNFWATWCVPCREEMPYFQALADEHSDGLVVLGVNMREEAKRIQPFIDEMGLTFPILLDPPNELISEHNVRGLPVSYVVGPDGTIVYRRIGEIIPEEFDLWLDKQLLALQSE